MTAQRGSGDDLGRILRLSPECDPTTLALSPEEGFLLSRIDGSTPWRLLREIGGMDADEADLCLEGWLANGLVEVSGHAKPPPRPCAREAEATRRRVAAAAPKELDEDLIDHSLDLDEETQRRILTFELRLDLPYYELLGVERDADVKEVKRAYFKLSKEFHPDRYFRRNIAGYQDRLARIFKRILEGYEILSDPELRAGLDAEGRPSASADAAASSSPPAPPDPSRPLTKLERLRQRMPFRIPERLLAERRHKADELFKAAAVSERLGQLREAVSSVRLAISFDPTNSSYRSKLVDLQALLAEERANELLAEGTDSYSMDTTQLKRVMRTLEDVLLYRPHDPAINDRAAAVALSLDAYKQALEYAQTAVEHRPEVADYHVTLGLVYKAQGVAGHAKKEFETALELDSECASARKALATMRLGRVLPAQEG